MKKKPPALENIGIDIDLRSLSRFAFGYPVRLVNGCALEFLRDYEFTGDELVYSDPPYLMHTRTFGRRYRHDYEEQYHIELQERLKTLPCSVILSGYGLALYDDLPAGWNRTELQVMNQAGMRTEKLWFNYKNGPLPLGSLRGQEFYRSPTHQTQSRTMREKLPGAAQRRTACHTGGHHGGGRLCGAITAYPLFL